MCLVELKYTLVTFFEFVFFQLQVTTLNDAMKVDSYVKAYADVWKVSK